MKIAITDLKQAEEYLYQYRLPNLEQKATKLEYKRVKYLARLFGDPQNKIKVIHVAGTSGKGSICSMISQLLHSQGFKVGLSVSPHLYDFRERCAINNELLDEKRFIKYLQEAIPAIEQVKNSSYGPASFLEIMIIFAYYVFWKERVQYAVMETATGGRLDATNVATREDKVAVISKIGLDHIDILGDTLKKITAEKAAIIHNKNIVVSIKQRPIVQRVVGERAQEMNTMQNLVGEDTTYSHRRAYNGKLRFDFSYKGLSLEKISLALKGLYQVENASIALAVLYELSKRDGFDIDEDFLRETLEHMKYRGRFEEIVVDGKHIVIDGAHNPQKMASFIESLRKRHKKEKLDFLIAFKKGKDFAQTMQYIPPVARKIFTTSFELSDQAEVMESEKPEAIEKVLNEQFDFKNVESIAGSENALQKGLQETDSILVITGSLYLISELYKKVHGMIETSQLTD